jgi:hypothetical protein
MISATNLEPTKPFVKAGQATETVNLHALITCPFSQRAFCFGDNMQIAVPHKLDDMNLSPEAYRLYLHLRCEMARQEANGSTLNLHRKIADILDKCKIEYAPSDRSMFRVFHELIERSMIIVDHEFVLADGFYEFYIESVTFTAEGEWQ